MTTTKSIQEIATIYGVAVEDVAVRQVSHATHLFVNQASLCGQINNNKYPELAGVKMSTHADTFGYWGVVCKSCNKNLTKKVINLSKEKVEK